MGSGADCVHSSFGCSWINPIYRRTVINEVSTEENRGADEGRKAPDWIPDNSIDGDEDLPWTRTVPVLAKPHPLGNLRDGEGQHLPGAESHSTVADGKGEVGTKKAGLVEKKEHERYKRYERSPPWHERACRRGPHRSA